MELTTAFTIIGSFGAASTAQIVNHILTQKRETKKYNKECFQNLYSPSIFKIIDYIKHEGYHNSPNEIIRLEFTNKFELLEEIILNIGNNLKYSEPELIDNYQELIDNVEKIHGDITLYHSSDDFLYSFVKFANTFLDHYLKMSNSLNLSFSIKEKIITPHFFCNFYILMKDLFAKEQVSDEFIFSYYDLIDFAMLPNNNYLDQIIKIRKETDYIWYINSNYPSADILRDAHHFLYEIANEFTIASSTRADELIEFMDEALEDSLNP